MEGLGINLPFLITQIVHITILYWLFRRFLYKPIFTMLEQRREKIRESLTAAESARAEAATRSRENEEIIAEARRKAQEIIRQAEDNARRRESELVTRAREEANAVGERERQQIAYERQQAMSQLRDEVARLSLDIARRTISESLINKQAHARIVDEVLAEAGAA